MVTKLSAFKDGEYKFLMFKVNIKMSFKNGKTWDYGAHCGEQWWQCMDKNACVNAKGLKKMVRDG